MVRPTRLALLFCLSACGLERDWERWQQASQSGSESTGSSTSADASTADTSSETSGSADAVADTSSDTTSGLLDATTLATTSTSTTSETTTTPASICGDGVVDDGEECDDPGDLHCFKCYRDRLVFVTSQSLNGDFALGTGGVIDYMCNQFAAKAGLLTNNQPRFKAWISTSEGSAADRLYHSPGRYILRNDLVFAESWDDLVAGNLLNTLDVDENSQTNVAGVWTDTNPDGSELLPPGGDHCDDWTNGGDGPAYWGLSDAMDSQWVRYTGPATNPTYCFAQNSLYCFESP